MPVGVGGLAHVEAVLPQDRPDAVGADPVHGRTVGQAWVEEGLGLGDPDLTDTAPQPRGPVERADHDRQDEHDEGRAEPRRAEDREDRQALEDVDETGTEERVVSRVDLVHRRGVVGRGAEREVGQLLDRHPDDGHQHQEDDLGDGEVDRREEPPQSLPDAGEDVGAGRSGGGRGDDGRGRDGRLLGGHDRRQGRLQAHSRAPGHGRTRGHGRAHGSEGLGELRPVVVGHGPDATPERRRASPARSERPSPGPCRPALTRTSRRPR